MDPAVGRKALLEALSAAGVSPRKRWGQNFLVDASALRAIVAAAEIGPEDTVLEVGPGAGTLTRALAKPARQVITVEIDPVLAGALPSLLRDFQNVRIVQGDVLKIDLASLLEPPYLVVANIPYYITSALIRRFVELQPAPTRIVLTIQKEVAERVIARGGAMSLLALGVRVYGEAQIVARIPAGAFYPPPKVDSAVLRIIPYVQPLIPRADLPAFFHLARLGFAQKRKMLRNTLSAGLQCSPQQAEDLLRQAGIAATRRAETLNLEEWKTLTRAYLLSRPSP
jgi:16S rRNA (adenine1518-N6/adenine1519-N6)-dimethyltransferase